MYELKRVLIAALCSVTLSTGLVVPLIMWGIDDAFNDLKTAINQIQKQNDDQQKSWENQLVECGK